MKILTMTLLASGKVHAMGELRMVLVIGHENRDMSRKTYLGCFISSENDRTEIGSAVLSGTIGSTKLELTEKQKEVKTKCYLRKQENQSTREDGNSDLSNDLQ
ncbi:hypothetical protein H5410_009847 [Solanum commersonii]|uniref:Uncharacterized protein n=1 Tax=Solanum commersonii TaxID=4109 RepID=A0A9J6AJ31_SOLCO|nr:hypothetical protein H5410_009847 [Solanum commersonii]